MKQIRVLHHEISEVIQKGMQKQIQKMTRFYLARRIKKVIVLNCTTASFGQECVEISKSFIALENLYHLTNGGVFQVNKSMFSACAIVSHDILKGIR